MSAGENLKNKKGLLIARNIATLVIVGASWLALGPNGRKVAEETRADVQHVLADAGISFDAGLAHVTQPGTAPDASSNEMSPDGETPTIADVIKKAREGNIHAAEFLVDFLAGKYSAKMQDGRTGKIEGEILEEVLAELGISPGEKLVLDGAVRIARNIRALDDAEKQEAELRKRFAGRKKYPQPADGEMSDNEIMNSVRESVARGYYDNIISALSYFATFNEGGELARNPYDPMLLKLLGLTEEGLRDKLREVVFFLKKFPDPVLMRNEQAEIDRDIADVVRIYELNL